MFIELTSTSLMLIASSINIYNNYLMLDNIENHFTLGKSAMAAIIGLEPIMTESKSVVLPLHHIAISGGS